MDNGPIPEEGRSWFDGKSTRDSSLMDKLLDCRSFNRTEFNLAYLLRIIGARPFHPLQFPVFFYLSNDDP